MCSVVEFYLQDNVLDICLRFQHAVLQIFHGQELAAADIPGIWHTDTAEMRWIKALWKQEPASDTATETVMVIAVQC